MPLLDDLPAGSVVGLDTAPLIYFIEGHADYGPVVLPFFIDRLEQGLNEAITSVVSLGEVLVQPLAAARLDLVQRYKDHFSCRGSPPHYNAGRRNAMGTFIIHVQFPEVIRVLVNRDE